ncbi:MAG: hypothetical protein AAF358_04515 [Pseudomonadota bacterium]
MDTRFHRFLMLIITLAGVSAAASELSGGEFSVRADWISNAGGRVERQPYSANTTTGQARLNAISGGEFSVVGGFSPTPTASSVLFADSFETPSQ